MSLAAKIRLLAGIAIGTIAIIALSSSHSLIALKSSIQDVRRSHDVAREIDSVFMQITQAETAQRGFIITGRENYLEPYDEARLGIPKTLADLDRDIVNSTQREGLNELRPLIARRLSLIAENVAARRRSFAAAQALVMTDRGRLVMVDIRSKISVMKTRQDALLVSRQAKRDFNVRRTQLLIILGGIAACIFILAASVAIMRELAGKARLQRELDSLREQVSDQVSHELRSPLTATCCVLSLLLDENLSPVMHENVGMALRNANHMVRMIDDLLDAARSSTGKLVIELERVDLSAVTIEIVTALQAIASIKGINISTEIAQDLPAAKADSGRYRQILTNIAENALKFTPKGGRVLVTLRRSAEDGFIEAAVADTGPGMAPEDCEKIFDRLYQAARLHKEGLKGLGLGLHITRELVQRHGGRIWVESALGEGSTFRFTLPTY